MFGFIIELIYILYILLEYTNFLDKLVYLNVTQYKLKIINPLNCMNIKSIATYLTSLTVLLFCVCETSCVNEEEKDDKNINESVSKNKPPNRHINFEDDSIYFIYDSMFIEKTWRLIGIKEEGLSSNRAEKLKHVYIDEQSLINEFVNTIQYYKDTSIQYCSGYNYHIDLISDKGDKIQAAYRIIGKRAIALISDFHYLFDADLWFEVQNRSKNLTEFKFKFSNLNKAKDFYKYAKRLKTPKLYCYIKDTEDSVNPDSSFMNYSGGMVVSFNSTKNLSDLERGNFLDSVLKEAINSSNYYFDLKRVDYGTSNSYTYAVYCNKFDSFNSDKINLLMEWKKLNNISLKVYTDNFELLQSYYNSN